MRKKKHPLPGVSTLKKWARKINMQPRIMKNILKLMEKTQLKEYEKICTLSFDEMKIKASYEYDKANDSVLKPSNYVQVIMARGLSAKWKQPVFYNYDCNMTASILNEVISELYHIGYMVVGVVSDMGPGNQSLWKELQIGLMKTWFFHPQNPQKKVFVFADAPHLLKLVRNHFIDTGFVYNEKLINIEPIKEMLNITSSSSDLKISHKLKDARITAQNTERQNTRLAAQLLSHSVSCCIKRCVQLGKTTNKNSLESANFVKLMNDWFDLFNSKVPEIDSRDRVKAYDLALEEQNKILGQVDEIILNLKKAESGRKALLPFQKGILISNKSLRGLHIYLRDNYDFKYILTNRLNQDILENFFSCIRYKGGFNDHPTALEFKYRLRSYLLGKLFHMSK